MQYCAKRVLLRGGVLLLGLSDTYTDGTASTSAPTVRIRRLRRSVSVAGSADEKLGANTRDGALLSPVLPEVIVVALNDLGELFAAPGASVAGFDAIIAKL
jgi:hypothetical protein